MKNSALVYIKKDNKYLMLHRIKKQNDCNRDKWIGIGGKFEDGESPEECMIREVKEETTLDILDWEYRGIVTFVSDEWETEYMHLFISENFCGNIPEGDVCDEGVLEWVDIPKVSSLALWEGDKLFLELLAKNVPFFSMKLQYKGENLVCASLNGKKIR